MPFKLERPIHIFLLISDYHEHTMKISKVTTIATIATGEIFSVCIDKALGVQLIIFKKWVEKRLQEAKFL